MKNFRERLGRDILIFDGGSGTLLQSRGLPAGYRPECWNIEKPEEIERLHAEYIEAGADIIKTNTFGANCLRFPDGMGYSVEQTVSAALTCAESAVRASGRDVYIALDLGPCGMLVGADIGFNDAVEVFARTVRAGKDRADLCLIETFGNLAETRAALLAVKENCDLPVIVTNAYEKNGRTFTGSDPSVLTCVLTGMGADAVGMNCSVGPDEMLKLLPQFLEGTDLPLCVNPNAGLPHTDENGNTVYDVTPEHFASCAVRMAKMGVSVLGGCCGTTPAHIRAVKRALGGIAPAAREKTDFCRVASVGKTYTFGKSLCVIGERINPTGKKLLKEALRTGDYDYCVNEAHSQESCGADILDINTGIPDIDEPSVLCDVVTRVQQVTNLPLQIDTSSAEAMERALRLYNGQALINSVNGSEKSLSSVLPLAAKYGGTVIGLTLDEKGIPDSPEGRLEIARRIVDRAAEYGIGRNRVIIDPLTLTLGADPQAADKTLGAVRLIKKELGVRCSLGVSNISFGLPDREKVNCGFLSAAVEAGLDAAIMNPGVPSMMAAARGDGMSAGAIEKLLGSVSAPAVSCDTSTLGGCITGGMKDRAAALAAKLCDERNPEALIAEEVIPALDRAGVEFGNGTVFLPGLLATAGAAIAALGVISERIESSGREKKSSGTVVMATVEGDVHDIGKNIVCVMLRSYGFTVIDLGKNVPARAVADAVKSSGARVVGLSALMTTTAPSMKTATALLKSECPDVKVVCGGAVLNEEYVRRIGADCYAPDASATVRFAESVYNDRRTV